MGIIGNIEQEYHANIDKYSQNIIISQIEILLNYSERFYNRQFLSRKKANHQILDRMEMLLLDYFNSEDLIGKGLPSVKYLGDRLNVSPKYLSSLLRVLTGQSALQHIHEKLIEKRKKGFQKLIYPLARSPIRWGLNTLSHSINSLKIKRALRQWNFVSRLCKNDLNAPIYHK